MRLLTFGLLGLLGVHGVITVASCGAFGEDTSATDAASESQGSSEAGDVDAGPTSTSPCAARQPHLFCADFDKGAFADHWTSSVVSGTGASIDLVPSPTTGGNALRANLSPVLETRKAFVQQTFPNLTPLRVELDVKIERPPFNGLEGYLAILSVTTPQDASAVDAGGADAGPPAQVTSYVYVTSAGEFQLSVQEPDNTSQNPHEVVPLNTWFHVVMDIAFRSAGHIDVSYRLLGETELKHIISKDITTPTAIAPMRVDVGLQNYVGQAGDKLPKLDVLYDNVTIDLVQL